MKAIAQIGIFIPGVPTSAPNKDNAITFMKWFAHRRRQTELAEAGDVPVRNEAASRTPRRSRRTACCRRSLAAARAGAQPRPRTPDWSEVEALLGTELNKALVAGKGGGARSTAAAKQSTAYLKRQGYYS